MFRLNSQKDLLSLALFYCSKRETSKKKLGQYLERKCREQKIDKTQCTDWIQVVLKTCEDKKVVDDRRYSEMLVREFQRRGKSQRYVENKLKEKGIPKEIWEIPNNQDDECNRAVALANKVLERLKLKVTRKIEKKNPRFMNEKMELHQLIIQKLATSGFSIEIAKKVAKEVTN